MTASTHTSEFRVTGMTCAACQARVQRTLGRTPGVADASVNLMMNSATVEYDPAVTDADTDPATTDADAESATSDGRSHDGVDDGAEDGSSDLPDERPGAGD